MQKVSREVESSSTKFIFQSLSNWQAMQSCWKSSLGTKTITSSFSSFRSHLFITQSHRVTNLLPYHNKMLLFLVLLQKNQAEALVKKSACCFTPICCLPDSKKAETADWAELAEPKESTETVWGTKYLCQKEQELPSLSSFSLRTAHDTKATFFCGTRPANCRLQGRLQTQCALYVWQLLHHPRMVREIMSW